MRHFEGGLEGFTPFLGDWHANASIVVYALRNTVRRNHGFRSRSRSSCRSPATSYATAGIPITVGDVCGLRRLIILREKKPSMGLPWRLWPNKDLILQRTDNLHTEMLYICKITSASSAAISHAPFRLHSLGCKVLLLVRRVRSRFGSPFSSSARTASYPTQPC